MISWHQTTQTYVGPGEAAALVVCGGDVVDAGEAGGPDDARPAWDGHPDRV